MKFLKYFLIWLGVLLVFACVAGYVYVRLEGKSFFEKKLTKFFNQSATIEEVRYLVPAGVRFHNLTIENILEAEDVYLHLKLPFLMDRRFIVARLELISPVFHLVRPEKKEIDFGGAYLAKQEERFQSKNNRSLKNIEGVLIDFLSVDDGRFEILDLSVAEPVKYDVGEVDGKAMKVSYPLKDQNIKFDVEGEIFDAGNIDWLRDGSFVANGWINWPAKAMAAAMELESKNGILGHVDLVGEKNIIEAKGKMTISQENDQEAQKGVEEEEGVLGMLQGLDSKLEANFNFETTMDGFQLHMLNFDGSFYPSEEKKTLDGLNPTILFGIGKTLRDEN